MSETKTFQLAPVTTERVERFMALMCRFGIDTLLDQVMDAVSPEPVLGQRSTGLRAETSEVVHAESEAVSLRLDMGAVFRELAKGGALRELAAIVVDVEEARAGEVPVDVVVSALRPFGMAFATLMNELLTSVASSALPMATA